MSKNGRRRFAHIALAPVWFRQPIAEHRLCIEVFDGDAADQIALADRMDHVLARSDARQNLVQPVETIGNAVGAGHPRQHAGHIPVADLCRNGRRIGATNRCQRQALGVERMHAVLRTKKKGKMAAHLPLCFVPGGFSSTGSDGTPVFERDRLTLQLRLSA